MIALRSSRFIWGLRIAQCLLTIGILGLTGENSSSWHAIGCDTPKRLGWNIACAALTLPLALMFIFTTGPVSWTKLWSSWLQIGLDFLFLIFWISATAVSAPDCDDVCPACSAPGSLADQYNQGFTVTTGSLQCYCVFDSDMVNKMKREIGLSGRASSSGSRSGSASKVVEKAMTIATKQGLDGVMIFFFLLTFITAMVIKFRGGQSSGAYNAQHAGVEHKSGHDVETDAAGNVVENM